MSSSGVGPGTSTLPGVVKLQGATSGNQAEVTAANALDAATSGDTATNADAIATTASATKSQVLALGLGFNGSTFDRARNAGAVGDGLGVQLITQPSSTQANSNATNAATGVTFAAVAGQSHRLTSASASYSATPTGAGSANVQNPSGTNIFGWLGGVTPAGPALPPGGMLFPVNTSVVVTLAAGGIGIIGWVLASKLTY